MSHALKAAIEEAGKAAAAIADKAIAEGRDLTDTEQAEFTAHLEKGLGIKRTLMGFGERKSQLGELSTDLLGDIEPDMPSVGIYPNTKARKDKDTRSIGEQFVTSQQWSDMLKNAPGGKFSEKARVQGAPFQVKALLTGVDRDTSAGALLTPDAKGLLDPYYQRPLTVRNLVTSGQTTTDVIEYVRLITVTNAAAPVAEATTEEPIDPAALPPVTAVDGGLKPQSSMEFEKDSTNVKTIAHWMAATKRALSDAAQIRTLIDTFLRYGLEEELEDQMVTGDGTGENFLGLLNTSGVQTETGAGATIAGVEAMRRARRKVQIGGRTTPTAYVMNPLDWEKVELLKDGQQRFYGNGPFALGPTTLWGLPVVESEAMPAGIAFCADWRQAILWDREEATIQVTDSHADFFVRNLVAILAELRAAFAVMRPPAFCKITLT